MEKEEEEEEVSDDGNDIVRGNNAGRTKAEQRQQVLTIDFYEGQHGHMYIRINIHTQLRS